jgi:hypothetical protein
MHESRPGPRVLGKFWGGSSLRWHNIRNALLSVSFTWFAQYNHVRRNDSAGGTRLVGRLVVGGFK